jgi:hypothetical protein
MYEYIGGNFLIEPVKLQQNVETFWDSFFCNVYVSQIECPCQIIFAISNFSQTDLHNLRCVTGAINMVIPVMLTSRNKIAFFLFKYSRNIV